MVLSQIGSGPATGHSAAGQLLRLDPEHPDIIDSLRELVRLYDAWNKPEEAEKWRAKLPRLAGAEGQE